MISPDSAQKVGVNYHATDASLIAVIGARQSVILKACTRSFRVRNHVNVYKALAIMTVKSQRAGKIVDYAWSS